MMKKSYLFVLSAVSVLTIVSCNKDNYKDPKEVNFEVSQLNDVDIHTELQNQFLDSEDPDEFVRAYTYPSYKATESNSSPNSFEINYQIDSGSIKPKKVTVNVSESEDMSNPMVFKGDLEKATIINLKVNQKYYYQVAAKYVSTFTSEVKSFTVTTNKARNIYVEGVENVRDLGGWDIGENRIYKQGLIYRTAQFNYGGGNNTYESAPTKEGVKTLKNQLKIKTEIDLRQVKIPGIAVDEVNGITSSPLGKDVKYVSAPMKYGGNNIFELEFNKESLKLFFETLSDINNYPIAFHCLRGTDRTGGLAYVLGALVGMSEEDLLLDYLFSDLARIDGVVRESTIEGLFVKGIEQAKGNTYSEKARSYLLSQVDITSETLDKIVNILVG